MNEEEIKKLQEEMAQLKEQNEALQKSVAEKDAVIARKTEDIVGQRKQYKRLTEMTQEEKDALSQKEIELQERMEAFEAAQEKFREEQAEVTKREVTARQNAAIKRLVGDNEEYAQKLRDNFNAIKDSEQAFTEEEVTGLMSKAFNMLGDDKPNPINSNLGQDGAAPTDTAPGGFADTAEGKELSGMMNLAQEPAQAPAADVPNTQ